MSISFWIAGIPKAKGSLKAVSRVKTKEGFRQLDRPIMYSTSDKLWVIKIVEEAKTHAKRAITQGPIILRLEFRLPKPKNAPKSAFYVDKRPDLSNYVKLVEDALKGILFRDDAQIAKYDVMKVYSEHPGLQLTIDSLDGGIFDYAS